MRRSRCFFFDSFKAARGELDPLFSPFKSEEHLRNAVRQYIVPAASRRRHRHLSERLGRAQERSLFRTSVSLVLQEARRRADHRVAAAALEVALTEARPAHLAQELEPAWVKDAVASCRSVEELRLMEGVLRKHEQQLLASGTAAGTEGFLLTAAFGRAAAVTDRGRRLGDDDGDAPEEAPEVTDGRAGSSDLVEGQTATPSALASTSHRDGVGSPGGLLSGKNALSSMQAVDALSEERRVSAALAQPPSLSDLATSAGDDSRWVSPEARAAAGLRRLQRQHRDITAGPNVSFTRYFLHQGLVRSESELMALYQAMRSRPEDVAFRVVGGAGIRHQSKSGSLRNGTVEALPHSVHAPYADAVHALLQRRRGVHQVPWLPDAMGAYTLDTRVSLPHDVVLSNRHLLRSLARERLVVYQSLSSMLPVLFLNPQPGEVVLDLCASPGNKTGLILDAMHGASPTATSATSLTSGCVVANEAQASRLRDLQERLRDLSPEVAVTRGRGEGFGSRSGGGPECDANALAYTDGEALYDAILVDAPCSGEGRMSRDALSWRLWHPGRGLEFFPTQCALLQRAVRLCKTGGRVVYATCTLNPLENEAVVAAVLRACGGAVELVPLPNKISTLVAHPRAGKGSDAERAGEGEVPMLRLTPGLRRWDVPSSAGGFLRTADEAYAQGESRSRLLPEMFAEDAQRDAARPAAGDAAIGAELHRCCRRVMPHLNGNTDGFFVAVLRKTSDSRCALPSVTVAARPSSVLGTASSLAVSLAGGSNLLNDRGFVRLQASNAIVQRHLGGFFGTSSTTLMSEAAAAATGRHPRPVPHHGSATVQDFLDRHGWTAMWCEGEGLRLLSTSAVQLLHRHSTAAGAAHDPSTFSTGGNSTQLLEAGVVVVNAQGELTERGAALLRASATRRVFALPLPYAQLLLANRALEIGGSLRLMPAFMQEAEAALNPHQGLLRPAGSRSDALPPTPQWCLDALAALSDGVAGSAIVYIDVASSGAAVAGPGGAASEWAATLAPWSWPVRVEVLRPWTNAKNITAGLMRLHLTLPPPSRHRTLALIGRLQGHAHRLRAAPANQQEQLQASSSMSPSLMIGSRELHGAPTQASQQHRQLFHSKEGRLLSQVTAQAKNEQTPLPVLSTTSTVFEL